MLSQKNLIRTTIGLTIAVGAAALSYAGPKPVRVIVENLAPQDGTYITPVWVGFHDGTYDTHTLGDPASTELERIAEDGNTMPLMTAFGMSAAGSAQGTIVSDSGIPPLAPGETATMTFTVDAVSPTGRYLSYASMVIPSNDAFVANDAPDAHQVFDPSGHFLAPSFVVLGSEVKDAGTEMNTELPDHTAFFGQMSPDTGIDENGVVHAHPGFLPPGSGGILDDPMFANADFTQPGYEVALFTTLLVGDLNCDGAINAADIDPFVLALVDPAGYAAAWPDCDRRAADIDGNGLINAGDIDPFVMLLTQQPDVLSLELDFAGLPMLGPDYVYEGWLIVGGMPVSSGRFVIDANGDPVPSSFNVDADDATNATTFVLTIEPAQNDPPEPADTHILAGPFNGYTANITVDHPAALGTDFTSAAGSFILATPSTANIDPDYDQGIWWLDPMAGPGPSLTLPPLPAGWAYEGWVVDPNGPISTGRFLTASGADSDGGGPAAGPDPTPPFPGQDFINPPLSLIGLTAVISVEPEPDDSPAPFVLKPLVDMTIEDIMPPMSQSMANNAAATNPTGTVDIVMP